VLSVGVSVSVNYLVLSVSVEYCRYCVGYLDIWWPRCWCWVFSVDVECWC
jgi:hypothetical protein